MTTTNKDVTHQITPPAASPGHADKLFDLFRRITPQKVDTKFIADNEITTMPNAGKVVDLAEWLGLIDQNGNVIQAKISKLKLAGDDRNKYVAELVKAAYKDLLERTDLQTATKNDVINYFIHNYNYGSSKAEFAGALFLHLCELANIQLGEALKKNISATREGSVKPKINRVTSLGISRRSAPTNQHKNDDSSNTLVVSIEGKRHELDLHSPLDKVIFEALSKELLKNWGKKENPDQNDAEGNKP